MAKETLNDTVANIIDSGIQQKKSSDKIAKALIETIKSETIKRVKEELRKHLVSVFYADGYPIKAATQSTIEGLDFLVRPCPENEW